MSDSSVVYECKNTFTKIERSLNRVFIYHFISLIRSQLYWVLNILIPQIHLFPNISSNQYPCKHLTLTSSIILITSFIEIALNGPNNISGGKSSDIR